MLHSVHGWRVLFQRQRQCQCGPIFWRCRWGAAIRLGICSSWRHARNLFWHIAVVSCVAAIEGGNGLSGSCVFDVIWAGFTHPDKGCHNVRDKWRSSALPYLRSLLMRLCAGGSAPGSSHHGPCSLLGGAGAVPCYLRSLGMSCHWNARRPLNP